MKTKLVKLKGVFLEESVPMRQYSLQPWRETVDNAALMFMRVRACCIVAA